MGTFVIKNRPLWVSSLPISDIATTVAIDYSADAVDNTVLIDTTRSNAGGLYTVGFSAEGYSDFNGYDATMFSNVATAQPVTFAGESGTEQSIAYLLNAMQLTHSPLAGAVGDMSQVQISGAGAGPLVRGILESNQSTASSGTSTGYQLGAVSATQSVYANLHVTAAAGSTLDVIVESDDNAGFTSATTRMTFTQATGITSEHLNLAGAITDNFWRVSYTIAGGSFDFAVSFGML